MNIKQAKRIQTPGNGDEGVKYGYYVADGFLEAVKGAEPLVKAVEKVLFEGTTESEASAIEGLEAALEKYKREVLGEER